MKYSHDYAALLLRIGVGILLFAFHGWGKIVAAYKHLILGQPWGFVGTVQGIGFPIPTLFATLAALAESLGSVLLILGLFGRWPALIIAINMTVAVYRHLSRGEAGESAFLFLIPAVALALTGPGQFAVGRSILAGKRRLK